MVVVEKSLDEMLEEIEVHTEYLEEEFLENPFFVSKGPHYIQRGLREDAFSSDASRDLFAGVAMVALENAIVHGHKHERLPYYITIYEGKKGCVLSLRDSGEGFDFKETQRKFKEGEKYWITEGRGFVFYNYDEIEVSFEEKGNIINLMSKIT